MVVIFTLVDGNHTIVVEDDNCQWVIPVTEDLPNQRPASETFAALNSVICNQSDYSTSQCNSTLISATLAMETMTFL